MPFIPKNKKKWAKSAKVWVSELKFMLQKKSKFSALVAITLTIFFFYCLRSLFPTKASSAHKTPATHGIYENEVLSSTPLIFPSVQDHETLKQLGVEGLFTLRIDVDGNREYILKPADPPLTEAERKELAELDMKKFVKKSFSDHGKLVYKSKVNHPEVVIVTLIDFENYSLDHIIRTVQNKVDYAQRHNYGVYVRWAQEFLPLVQKQNMEASYEFIKPLAVRAAMNAFPYAKYFWFFDHNGLIMKLDTSLQQQLLEPKVLEAALLKGVPVTEKSNIKTYKHFNPKNAKIIIPKTESGRLDTSSFVVTPSVQGKAFLDYFSNPLVRNYPWADKFTHAIGHMLQWHPKILQKTALVVPKTIASLYDISKSKKNADDSDAFTYRDGDFVVTFSGCQQTKTCETELEKYYQLVKQD
ncbi:unnamed protein product [Kluyveromyces dobzhanskii CBS 2104]|uniref:WGS project CCBQ000000000 data, contig 00107 n=1 Tax=Kluyveromyces dobzhanskii CBS 2104 TaxID=1427455 RepID=A0A0A8KZ34_9SACH|nr:unnamed protein product [Kluyveromyces dobzhanskii CBS 2104]